MMPFSVLRIWGGGLLSWAILLGGIYCIWKWNDQRHDDLQAVHAVQEENAERPARQTEDPDAAPTRTDELARGEAANATPVVPRGDHWPLLALGIGLLAWSGIGFLPILLFLGRPGKENVHESPRAARTQFINRPANCRLCVESVGPPEAVTILFTHGWSLESTVWNQLKSRLAGRFRLITWDLPGLGRSRGPDDGNYEVSKMADDLAAVIEQAGPGPIVLVGHSIGGMITQTLCRQHPELLRRPVAGIVLLHTTYTNPLRTAFLAPLWRAIEKPVLVPLNHLTVWLAPLAWLSNWQSYLNGSLHISTRVASFSGRQTWQQLNYAALLAAKAWPGVISRGNLAMTKFEEEPFLRRLDVPALVIAGEHDRMTQPSASEHIDDLLPQGMLATVKSGHLGFWEQTDEVAELIAEFAERFQTSHRESSAGAAMRAARGEGQPL